MSGEKETRKEIAKKLSEKPLNYIFDTILSTYKNGYESNKSCNGDLSEEFIAYYMGLNWKFKKIDLDGRYRSSVADNYKKVRAPYFVISAHEDKRADQGIYISYLFDADCEHIYLTLNQGSKTILKSKKYDVEKTLKLRSKKVREIIKCPVDEMLVESIKIGDNNGGVKKEYIDGIIACDVCYVKNEIPSEEILKEDMKRYLGFLDDFKREVDEDKLNEIFVLDDGTIVDHPVNKHGAIIQKDSGTDPKCLNTILYGPPGTGKTYSLPNRVVDIVGINPNEPNQTIKERYLELLVEGRQVKFVTFHQSYGYEEFIEGIKPDVKEGSLVYKEEDGVFKTLCVSAASDPNNGYVMIIDEINRGNVSQIFGELITLIEDTKRLEPTKCKELYEGTLKDIGNCEAAIVSLPYSGMKFAIPSNVYIIGTMNTADRSLTALDTALRRRFSFEEKMPVYEELDKKTISGINLGSLLRTINERITRLYDREHQIGQSYLIDLDNFEELQYSFKMNIIPLLQEYFFNDYSKIQKVLRKEGGSGAESSFVSSPKNDFDDENPIYEIKIPTVPLEYVKIYKKMDDEQLQKSVSVGGEIND